MTTSPTVTLGATVSVPFRPTAFFSMSTAQRSLVKLTTAASVEITPVAGAVGAVWT